MQHEVVVIAVDDNFSALRSIKKALKDVVPDEKVHMATDSTMALELGERYLPDIITVDAEMRENGLAVLRSLRKAFPLAAMVAIAGIQGEAIMYEAFGAGANAFVAKTDLPSVLPPLISSFRAGKNLQPSF